jgi:hypothetical protein
VNLADIGDAVAYSVDLEGGIHLIALDNVSRKGEGFGSTQLKWLAADLDAASAADKIILVGMHKGLAKNPVTTHAMDEDGPNAIQDSDAALALFTNEKYKKYVAMVFVSHSHMYAAYNQDGLEVRLTGGLGAPLVKGLSEDGGGFHHFLIVVGLIPSPRTLSPFAPDGIGSGQRYAMQTLVGATPNPLVPCLGRPLGSQKNVSTKSDRKLTTADSFGP